MSRDVGGKDDCPSWCAGEHPDFIEAHGGSDPSTQEDFIHSTLPINIPVVCLFSTPGGSQTMAAQEFDVVLFQNQFATRWATAEVTREQWLFIGSEAAAITLTRESAERLYRALGETLAMSSW